MILRVKVMKKKNIKFVIKKFMLVKWYNMVYVTVRLFWHTLNHVSISALLTIMNMSNLQHNNILR